MEISQWNQGDNDLHARVHLSESARLALQWWSSQHNLGRGSPTHPLKPHHMVYSDASIEGWGGHTQGLEVAGLWTRAQTQYHINSLVMMAVHNVLIHWKDIFVNSVVLVGTDNSTVVAYLNKQETCAPWQDAYCFGQPNTTS